MARRFEYVKGMSSKFWQIDVKGSTVSVHFGKIGTKGQEKAKEFADAAAAEAAARKLIDEKLGKGYMETGAAAAAQGANASSGHAGWGKLIDLVAPEDKEIHAEIALAVADPEAYLERFEERLSERGIDDADETLPSIAFLDALIDKGIAREIQKHEGPEEVLEWVEERLKELKLEGFTTEGWYEEVEDYDHVSDLVMAVAKALTKFAGASLIGLDLASDTYPVVILPTAGAKAFRDAGNAIGYESVDWGQD